MPRRPQDVTLPELLQRKRDTLRPPTATSLARALDVDQSTASRWLRGIPPDLGRAPGIAAALDLDVEEVERLIVNARRPETQPSASLERRLAEFEDVVAEQQREVRDLLKAQGEALAELRGLLLELREPASPVPGRGARR